ncbi:MAG: hypothetical protein ACOCP8_06765 [archaeon]
MEIKDEIINYLTKKGYEFKHSDKILKENIITFRKDKDYCVSIKEL